VESVTSSPRRSSSRSRSGGDRARDAANRQAFGAGYRVRMRGRWRWVLLGTLIAGPLAALAGWLTAHPTWRATGTVALSLSGPGPAEAAGDGADADTQPAAEPWQSARLDEVLERELDLLKRLGGAPASARRVPGTLTRLEVTVRADAGPEAEALVAGTLAAYRAQTQLVAEAETSDALEARARRLGQRRTALAERRRDEAAGLPGAGSDAEVGPAAGPGDAELRWQAAAAAADTARRRAEIATRHARVLLDSDPPRLPELASVDPETRQLMDRRAALDDALQNTVRPPSPRTAERMNERDALDAQLKARLADTRLLPPEPGGQDARPREPRRVSVNAALAQARRLEADAAAAAARMDDLEPRLSEQRRRAAALDAEAQSLRADAAELARERSALGPGGGAIRLAPAGDPGPDAAAVVDQDPRPRRALISGLSGLAAGGLLPLLWFLSDRRVRRTRQGELAGAETPLLGTVPVMDRVGVAGDASEDGPHPGPVASIDAVRAVLEARVEAGDRAFAVAGVAGGSGATSIAVGLAVSLALAGQRVLLIDLSWLQTPSDPGRDGGDPDPGRGVDGVLAELGYLDEEDHERLLLAQHASPLGDDDDDDVRCGFTALLAGGTLAKSVLHTRLPRLSVLSALGRGDALRGVWTGRLSSKWLRRLVEVCRGTGHVLVIDAGAADGGVEGVLTCAAADGALVVVTPRETQSDFVRSAGRLKLVGAHVIGTVLNRHGQRRIATGDPERRRVAAGGPRGSGLFAAAIEARRGDNARRAPLPRGTLDAAGGVDPVAEPPTAVRPTPERRPPAPLTGDRPEPEVHVVDDVMDQLVDHAIRSAQSHRRSGTPQPATPPATSGVDAPPK